MANKNNNLAPIILTSTITHHPAEQTREKESQKVAMMPLLDCFSPLPPGANGRDESIIDADDKLRMLASTDECKATIQSQESQMP